MEIIEVTPKEYQSYFSDSYHVFNSAAFNELNEAKAEQVYYLVFKDSKIRLGLITGVKEQQLLSPFSAPFGGFSFIKKDVKLQAIESAVLLLTEWANKKGLEAIRLTLPPEIYYPTFIAKQINVLFRMGFKIEKTEMNYTFDLINFDENYKNVLWRNARKNLTKALNNNLSFDVCSSLKDKEEAFGVIKQNRSERGFPLRMTWENILKTIEVVPADFFLVRNEPNTAIAAAMIFHVSENVVQVIYWGDLPDYAGLKTMNFLSYKVFEHYKNSNIRIVDIGPSTENSIPNYGLCEFKEGIGCDIGMKLTFFRKV